MDWDLFQVKFRKTKKVLLNMPYISVNKRRRENKQNNKPKEVHFFHQLPTEVRGSRRKSTMLHVTICSKYMHDISLVFYIM